MEKIKICFDVDGVILNFLQSISNFIEKEYDTKSKIVFSSNQYCLDARFDSTFIQNIGFNNIKKTFEKAGGWAFLEPMPEIDLIHDLMKDPLFSVSFLTNLPVHLHNERLKNLHTILGQFSSEKLICVPLGESKKPYIEKINPDFFIEDNLHNIRDCYGNHMNYWINLDENCYDHSSLYGLSFLEVNNLNEAIDHIKKFAEFKNNNKKKIKKD